MWRAVWPYSTLSVAVSVISDNKTPSKAIQLFEISFMKLSTTEPFPKLQILNSSKLNEFADDNFTFDGNGRKFSKQDEKHSGERKKCSLWAIPPFPTAFFRRLEQQTRKNQGLFGKGLNSPKLKRFADDHFAFDFKKWQKVFETVRKHCGTMRNCSLRYEQFLVFPQCFLKTCTAET